MALYPRRVTSTATTIQVTANDGTIWTYQNSNPAIAAKGISPAAYKGDQTFTQLQGVVNNILPSGGWSSLSVATVGVSTAVRNVYPTTAQVDAIAPRPALRQDSLTYDGDGQYNVWQSAAWNGYGFWQIPAGGHSTGFRNELYLLRVANPIGVYRIHDSAPRQAAKEYTTGIIAAPATWGSYPYNGLKAPPEWGPAVGHEYSSVKWDSAREVLIYGGDEHYIFNNPVVGQVAVETPSIWTFNPYASTPKSAWTRYTVPSRYSGFLGVVDNSDGTYAFRTPNTSERFTLNLSTGSIITGAPSGGPSEYRWFATCFRDPATNYYYETSNENNASLQQIYLIRLNGPAFAPLLIDLFCTNVTNYMDFDPGFVVINSKAYAFGFSGPGNSSTGTIGLKVARVDLTTRAIDYFNDGTTVTTPGESFPYGTMDGVWGRCAYVPQAGCFVYQHSPKNDILVFRPPSTWVI